MRKRQGFTLVELLVVMAIIAVLISIMVPALARARATAEFVVCKTKLRGCGQALINYLEDNRARFPNAGAWLYGPWDWDTDQPWWTYDLCWNDPAFADRPKEKYGAWRYPDHAPCGALSPYLDRLSEVALCPTLAKLMSPEECPVPGTEFVASYGINVYLGGHWTEHASLQPYWECQGFLKESQLERAPAAVLAFADEGETPYWNVSWSTIDTWLHPRAYIMAGKFFHDVVGGFHLAPAEDPLEGGVGNAVFLDGHVDAVAHVEQEDTYRLCWPGRRGPEQDGFGLPWRWIIDE